MSRRRPGALALAGLALVLGLPRPAPAADAEPGARVELRPAVAAVDEPVLLIFEITVEGLGGVDFRPAYRLENLSQVAGPNTTRIHNWVNGRATSGTRLIWRLRPGQPGPAAVRDVRVDVGGRELALPDREIRVVEAGGRPRAATPRRLDPFDLLMRDDPFAEFRRAAPSAAPKLRLSSDLSAPRVYVGEQLVWRLVLDTQTDVGAFHPKQLPEFEGFWVRDLPVSARLRPEAVEVDGETYWRVAPVQRALFPLRAGRFRWRGATAEVVARITEAGWIGPLARNETISLATGAVDVEVLPLPEPPAGFSGAVGELRVAAALDPEVVTVGRAATLTMTLSGSGHLSQLAPAPLALPDGLRSLEPSGASSEEVDGDRLRTHLTWTYVLVAERPGRYEISPPRLVWFDPGSAEYRTAGANPLLLAAVPTPTADLAGARAPPAVGGAAEPPTPSTLPLAAMAGLCLAALLATGLAVAGLARHRRRHPARPARRRLVEDLSAARRERDPARAAAVVEAAWRGWLAERWGIAAGAPVAHWPERLPAAGLASAATERLVELFQELHDLRYAPELSDVESLLREVHELSDELRRDLA